MITRRAVELFGLLANETRLGILTELVQARSGGLTINELVNHVHSSRSTIRRQIAILVETGLVQKKIQKRRHEFWANTVLLDTLREFMAQQLGNAPAPLVGDITSAQQKNGIFTPPATQSYHSLCDRLAEVDGVLASELSFGEPASVAIRGMQKPVRRAARKKLVSTNGAKTGRKPNGPAVKPPRPLLEAIATELARIDLSNDELSGW